MEENKNEVKEYYYVSNRYAINYGIFKIKAIYWNSPNNKNGILEIIENVSFGHSLMLKEEYYLEEKDAIARFNLLKERKIKSLEKKIQKIKNAVPYPEKEKK